MFRFIAVIFTALLIPSALSIFAVGAMSGHVAAVAEAPALEPQSVSVEVTPDVIERDVWTIETVSYPEALPLDPVPELQEDDPAWDCRTMGNRTCGVQIEGTWYLVTFDENGQPVGATLR